MLDTVAVAGKIQSRRHNGAGWITMGELVRMLYLPHSQGECAAILASIKLGQWRCPFSANHNGRKTSCVQGCDERTVVIPVQMKNSDVIVVHHQHHPHLAECALEPIRELTAEHVGSLMEYLQHASQPAEAIAS